MQRSYRCDTASSARSTASVYSIRSLVPIERKSRPERNAPDREHGRGHLDHAADLDVVVEWTLARAAFPSPGRAASVWSIGRRGEHRDEDLHLAVVRGAQDRAKLGQEQSRLGETEPHCAQAERGIGRDARESFEAFLVLVRTEIKRPDHDRLAFHPRRHAPIGSNCSSSDGARRDSGTGTRTEQADAGSARLYGRRKVVGQLDVRAARRARRRASAPASSQALELLPLEQQLALLQPVLGKHCAVRIDDDGCGRRPRSGARRRGSAGARCAWRRPQAPRDCARRWRRAT